MIFIYPTNCSEIFEIIKYMKLTNGGVESIHSRTLKLQTAHITDLLVPIINLNNGHEAVAIK